MYKAQCLGVQCLAWTQLEAVAHELAVFTEIRALQYLIAAIDIIIEKNVAYVLHVHPNLVRAACLKITLHKRNITQALKNTVVCDRIFAHTLIGRHAHLQPVARIAGYIANHRTTILLGIAPHYRIIGTLGGLLEELHSQMSLCKGGLCYNKQARCILVNAVYKANLRVIGIEIGIILQMPCNGIDERAMGISAPWMHDKAGGFVDHHKGIVLIHYIKRDILGDNRVVIRRGVVCNHYLVERLYLVVALDDLAVDRD